MEDIPNTAKVSTLPEEFKRRIEKDLNNVVMTIPDYLEVKINEMSEYEKSSNKNYFLKDFFYNMCKKSYIQAFKKIYLQTPSKFQIKEIDSIIKRRELQFEQGIIAFMKERV